MLELNEDEAAQALSTQIVDGRKPVIFMIGSGGSVARRDRTTGSVSPGVPTSQDIVNIIADRLGVPASSLGGYQDAFNVLIETDSKGKATKDLHRANLVIREAVLRARLPYDSSEIEAYPEQLAALEANPKNWWIPDAYKALALLGAHYPRALAGLVLTTNFDPLIEVAMTHARTPWVATALHEDGSLQYTRGSGPHVVHLHGHWWNSDTLHTEVQLTNERKLLHASLLEYLKKSTLVVIGYGGWKDVLTRTLERLDDGEKDVWWGVRGRLDEETRTRLTPFLGASGKFITDIDADGFLVKILNKSLMQRWADTRDVYLDRVLVENNHKDIYRICDEALNARGLGLDVQVRYLDKFEAGLSVIAGIHAARFITPLVDQQYVHAAYEWTEGSVARLALAEAQRIFHDDTAEADQLRLVDELLAFYLLNKRIPGRPTPAVLRVVKYALCGTVSYQRYKKLCRERYDIPEEERVKMSEVSGYEVSPAGRSIFDGQKYSFSTFGGKAVHAAIRVLGDDVRSVVQYIRACLSDERDHQSFFDASCMATWRDSQSEGRDFQKYILDMMIEHHNWRVAKEQAEAGQNPTSLK